MQVKSWLASSGINKEGGVVKQHKLVTHTTGMTHIKILLGRWKNLVSGIIGERCHNQFRAIFGDFKVVQTTNLKGLTKQEDELNPPPAWQCRTAHHSAHKGGNCDIGVTFFTHPPCNPGLAPSDFHLFCHLKDALQAHYFADDIELQHSMLEELWYFSKEFCATSIQGLIQRW